MFCVEQKISHAILNSSQPLNRLIIRVNDPDMRLHVYWIFLRSGHSDILLSERNRHSFYELQLMLDGFIRQKIETEYDVQYFTVEAGQFMIAPPEHYHQVTDSSEVGTRFSVAFQIESTDPYIQVVLEEIRHLRVFSMPENSITYIQLMESIASGDSPWGSKEISILLQCLLLHLFTSILPNRDIAAQRGIKPNHSALIVAEVQRYIVEHIADDITVENIAAKLGKSSRQLNRICRKQVNKTLNQLISAEKLTYIKELIGTSNLSFSEIASMVGFSSEYALNRFFKYAEGYTLSQYRRLAMLN